MLLVVVFLLIGIRLATISCLCISWDIVYTNSVSYDKCLHAHLLMFKIGLI